MTTARDNSSDTPVRKRAMQLLTRASADELSVALKTHWPTHGARDLKPVECGLVMLRGRMGGDGSAFNVGEATVTRAVVQLPTGERGYGHVLGRDRVHAHAAAVLDALLQQPQQTDRVKRLVLAPIEARLSRERAHSAAATNATRVEFFTLVRGEA